MVYEKHKLCYFWSHLEYLVSLAANLFSLVTHALSLFLMDLPIPAMKISNHPLGDYCKSLHEQTN